MDWKPRLATVVLTLGTLGAVSGTSRLIPFFPSITLLILGLAMLRFVPGWRRAILYGAAAGLVAGVLVLAPGFRLAMRVVAMLEPMRLLEFTPAGTLLILVGVGGIGGLLCGALGVLIRDGWSMKPVAAWAAPASVAMAILLMSGSLRDELTTLGAGPWLNIPMFAAVCAAYGWLTMWVVARLEVRREAKLATAVEVEVPA